MANRNHLTYIDLDVLKVWLSEGNCLGITLGCCFIWYGPSCLTFRLLALMVGQHETYFKFQITVCNVEFGIFFRENVVLHFGYNFRHD